MFQSPDHYHNLSLRLSEVLSDIGVNERIVMRRRRGWLLLENMLTVDVHLAGLDGTFYNFGSQTEASTTLELNSDIDTLSCSNGISVIQDWSEWELGKCQLLMVQDETTSPGYCLLQRVRHEMPLPNQDILDPYCTADSRGRVLMRHSAFFLFMNDGSIRHGPAESVNRGPDQYDCDGVPALHCSSWPKEAESWLQQQNVSGWPTADMKRYAVEHGCFVVAVASRAGVNENTEFRISTSHAERCLMFSLNMTQMRCYILMKMILKTYLKPKCGDTISSFMCKTVLFHCIADTRASEWNESNLLPCLNQCLQYLLHCILTENCPHFIIPGNNLLAGKLSFQAKQQVVEIMMTLTPNIEQSLLGISLDQLGNRLHVKSGRILPKDVTRSEMVSAQVLAKIVIKLADAIHVQFIQECILKPNSHNNCVIVYQILKQIISKLCQRYSDGSRLEQAACCLLAPPHCSIIGSIIASVNIHHSQPVSPAALQWFSAGLNSDFSSSRLKLASALYCAGHYKQCETILVHLNRQLEQTTVLTLCGCNGGILHCSEEFGRIFHEKNEVSVIQQNTALCVRFLPCETNCVPQELRYEMFRSTQEDLPYSGENDDWMDWAVIDSIPFLYFLLYKVYTILHKPVQQQALLNLARSIYTDPNLGHRETALNLLGQCMKEENRNNEALRCYIMSLKMKPRNNAAKWLICILLASLYNQRV